MLVIIFVFLTLLSEITIVFYQYFNLPLLGFLIFCLIGFILSVPFWGQLRLIYNYNLCVVNQNIFIQLLTLFISSALFFIFLNNYISDFSFIGFWEFSHKYRQGLLNHSYLYTFLSTKVLVLYLSYLIFQKCKFTLILYLILIYVIFVTLTLGLRIFLLPIFIAIIFRIKFNYKYFLIIFFLLLFGTCTKLYLNEDPSITLVQHFINLILRHDYHILINIPILSIDLNTLLKSFPIISYFTDLNIKTYLPKISSDFNSYTEFGNPLGVAFPVPFFVIFSLVGLACLFFHFSFFYFIFT